MDPVVFSIGPIVVYWYGIIITSGILVSAWVMSILAEKKGLDADHVWNALTICLILGVIGARLYHVFTPSPSMGDPYYYWHHPLEIFNIRRGGLGIYGAIIGGALGLILYARRQGLDVWTWLDLAAPSVALGQSIGRWGNFVNQELYGRPTDLPWGIYIDPVNRLTGYENYDTFHPTFLYESLLNLGIFALLFVILYKEETRLQKGDVFGLYIILYSIVRIILEFVRLDSPRIQGLAISQIVALVLIVAVGFLLTYRHYKKDM